MFPINIQEFVDNPFQLFADRIITGHQPNLKIGFFSDDGELLESVDRTFEPDPYDDELLLRACQIAVESLEPDPSLEICIFEPELSFPRLAAIGADQS